LYPKSGLLDDILYKRAEIAIKMKDYEEAAKYYSIVFTEYGNDILGDNALYQLALIHHYKMNNKEEALKNYEKFIATYTGSFFLNDCIKQYRTLRGDQIN